MGALQRMCPCMSDGDGKSDDRSKLKPRRGIDRTMIGAPANFQHTSHIGTGDVGSTELDNIQVQMQSKGGHDQGGAGAGDTVHAVDLSVAQAKFGGANIETEKMEAKLDLDKSAGNATTTVGSNAVTEEAAVAEKNKDEKKVEDTPAPASEKEVSGDEPKEQEVAEGTATPEVAESIDDVEESSTLLEEKEGNDESTE